MAGNKSKTELGTVGNVADLGALVEGTAVAFSVNRPNSYLVYFPGVLESIRDEKCTIIQRGADNCRRPRIETYTANLRGISLSPRGEIRINGNYDWTCQSPKDESYAAKNQLLTRAGYPLPVPSKFEKSAYIVWGC